MSHSWFTFHSQTAKLCAMSTKFTLFFPCIILLMQWNSCRDSHWLIATCFQVSFSHLPLSHTISLYLEFLSKLNLAPHIITMFLLCFALCIRLPFSLYVLFKHLLFTSLYPYCFIHFMLLGPMLSKNLRAHCLLHNPASTTEALPLESCPHSSTDVFNDLIKVCFLVLAFSNWPCIATISVHSLPLCAWFTRKSTTLGNRLSGELTNLLFQFIIYYFTTYCHLLWAQS